MTKRLGILECDHVDEGYRHVAGDYVDMFEALFARQRAGIELVAYDACNGSIPTSPEECDAWLITGSRRSVYEELGWIDDLCSFVRHAHALMVPCVGICFGHQLLAQALGGRTERAPGGWGAGAHRIELTGPTPWTEPFAPTCDLLFMHQDQVVVVPPGGVVLGRTEHCPVAVLGVGPSTLGVQAHPEFSPAYLEALLADRVERIGASKAAAAQQSLGAPIDADRMARWLVRFIGGGGS